MRSLRPHSDPQGALGWDSPWNTQPGKRVLEEVGVVVTAGHTRGPIWLAKDKARISVGRQEGMLVLVAALGSPGLHPCPAVGELGFRKGERERVL